MPTAIRKRERNSPRHPIAGSTLCIALTTAALTSGAIAADTNGDAQLSTIRVSPTGTSQGRPISAVPGSVTVIERENIEKRARTTQDMGEILSNLVPGFGLSCENLTNFGQNLRRRSFLVMIDGVPQKAVLRQGEKHLRSIAPEAVERVEVIRGAVATYGVGSTGGIINFITKSGEGAEDPEAERQRPRATAVSSSDDDGAAALRVVPGHLCLTADRRGLRTARGLHGGHRHGAPGLPHDQRLPQAPPAGP